MTPSAERKLTTILSADAAGYSRLMEQDETQTFATLKAYRDLTAGQIAHHRGRVVNTAGDSILAEFPSVVRAVECAIEIQRTIAERNAALEKERQMWFRIGINLGDVMVDDDDLFGDGVNVAARLQGLADPGGILISGAVFDHVKDKLAVGFDAMGQKTIKNISAQVPVYRVVLDTSDSGMGVRASMPQVPPDRPDDARKLQREERRHRILISTTIGGTLIVFLLAINLFAGGELWFQWPALAILLACALRTISLFRRRI